MPTGVVNGTQKIYTVYLHRNKINNKCYIGQTCKRVEHRWNNGRGYKSNTYFYRAIQKYGWDSFDHCILKSDLTPEEADYWEKYYIEEYKSTNPQFGYNLESGGNVAKVISDVTKQRMSQNHYNVRGKNNPMYGKNHSPTSLQKMSEVKKGRYIGENNPNFGNHKLSGTNHPKAKPVYQYDLNGNLIKKWDYAKLAAAELGINYSVICECCKNKYGRRTAGGFVWKYD